MKGGSARCNRRPDDGAVFAKSSSDACKRQEDDEHESEG